MTSMQSKLDTESHVSHGGRSSRSQAICRLELKDVPKGWSEQHLDLLQQQVLGDFAECFLKERCAVLALPGSLASSYVENSLKQTRDALIDKGLLCRPTRGDAIAPTRAGMRYVLAHGPARSRLTAGGEDVIAAADCALVVPNASVAFLSAIESCGDIGVAPLASIAAKLGFHEKEQLLVVARFALKLVQKGRIEVRFTPQGNAEVVDRMRAVETASEPLEDLRAPKAKKFSRPMAERRPSISPQEGEEIFALVEAAGKSGLSVVDVKQKIPHLGVGQISKFFKKHSDRVEVFSTPRRSDGTRFLYRSVSSK